MKPAIAVLALMLAAVGSGRVVAQTPAKPAAAAASPAAPSQGAAPAKPATALEKQEIRAQLSPKRFTTLASELGAKINQISVKEGDRFRAGQTLVSFDCSMQAAQQQKAKAVLAGAENVFGSNKRLAELNSVGKIDLDNSRAEVEKARADIALMSATLSKCRLAAPFGGRVAEQKVREQQYVQPGQAIMDILDDSTLELEFIVPSRWLVWLKAGSSFQVRIDETGKTYPARITRLGARIDPVSQSLKVAAVIDGSFPDLIAGMSGRIQFAAPAGQQ